MTLDSNITYFMELSGSFIPPGYACQWKMLPTFDNDYSFLIYNKVIGKDILRESDFVEAFKMALVSIPQVNLGLRAVKLATETMLGDEYHFFKSALPGIYFYDQTELTVISYKNRSIKYTVGFLSKAFSPTAGSEDPKIISLRSAVIALAVLLSVALLSISAYFFIRKYFPSEARILKKLNNSGLKLDDLDRILKRIKPQEYNIHVNKYNQTECSICMGPFDITLVRQYPICHHLYHSNCLEQMLRTNASSRNCPLCKDQANSQNFRPIVMGAPVNINHQSRTAPRNQSQDDLPYQRGQ